MLDFALSKANSLLGFLPAAPRGVVVLPFAVIALFLLIAWLLRMAPAIDRLLGPLGSGLATLGGLVALVPEYAITTLLRRSGRRPTGVVYLYDEIVEFLVTMGRRAFRAGVAGLLGDKRTRRWVALLAVVFIVGIGNAGACPDPPGSCQKPVRAWWQQTTSVFHTDDSGPRPRPTKPSTRPTRTTVRN